MEFYGIVIPKVVQPSLILSVENDELGITAGLQDRVIQVLRRSGLHGLLAGTDATDAWLLSRHL